jgi:hypothetical protein
MAATVLFVSILRACVELAGCALLGQALLGLLAGSKRANNPIYRLFQIVTGPPVRLVRGLLPSLVRDRHVSWITFLLLFCLWIALAWLKRRL